MNFLFYLVKWLTGSKRHSYGDDVIQVVKPRLDVDSVIKEIIRIGDEDDPFYVCEVNDIIRRHEEWEAAMPRVTTHYAVKCNSSKVVLQTLAALGTGFDCASKEEIRTVLSLGVQPDRIIFAHPTKMVSHLKYAADVGVTMMTFDNDYELQKIKSVYPQAKLLIRIKYDDLSARYLLGQKYGCDHDKEARDLLLKASSLKLDVVGVCFHIGSSSKDHSVFRRAIAAARQVYDEAADLGFNFKLLDIGGGFPGEKKKSIREVAEIINSALDEYFPDLSVKVTSEPGRYYVNTAFTLASNIHSVKEAVQTDPETKEETKIRMYYVGVSVFGGLIPVLFDEFFLTRPLNVRPDSKLRPSIVWGPTCDTSDKVSEGVVSLPVMEAGDWIVFEETGAYTTSIACEFNGFPTPRIHSVIDEDGWFKLTRQVPYPVSKEKFVIGNSSKDFKIGLTHSS